MCIAALAAGPVLAVGVGFSAGTTGIGPYAAIPASDNLGVRLGMGSLDLSRVQTVGGIDYDLDLGLSWYSLLLDVSPAGGRFRLTGGVMVNGSMLDASYVPKVEVPLGDNTYTPEELGRVEGRIEMQPVSPYLGIGFGSPSGSDRGLSLLLDAGVAFTSYEADLWHVGGSLPRELQEQLAKDLALEADSLQEELDRVSVYPVLSAGLMLSW